jgi:uncharacterized DUF497 family protein
MLTTRFEGFDWNAANRGKCQAHGVSIAEIESALLLDDMLVIHDAKHSQDEQRYIAAGPTHSGRYLFVAYTLRTIGGRTALRPITARYMHKDEAERYEKARTGL